MLRLRGSCWLMVRVEGAPRRLNSALASLHSLAPRLLVMNLPLHCRRRIVRLESVLSISDASHLLASYSVLVGLTWKKWKLYVEAELGIVVASVLEEPLAVVLVTGLMVLEMFRLLSAVTLKRHRWTAIADLPF